MLDRDRLSEIFPADLRRARLHPLSFVGRNHPLILIDGRCRVSAFDCITLVQKTMPAVRVFRHEREAGLIEDPVLAGIEGMVRLVAHWHVRLAAVEQAIGRTDLILVAPAATAASRPLIWKLQKQGTPVFWLEASLH